MRALDPERLRTAARASAWLRALALAALALGFMAAGHAQEGVLLAQDAWIEAGEQATVEQASTRFAAGFKPAADHTVYPLGPDRTLWLRLRLRNTMAQTPAWGLDLPVPLIDSVTLHQRNADGSWSAQTAGDQRAVAGWSRPGRYASFDLTLPAGAVREVFLQVRHADPIGFDLRIGPATVLEQGRQVEYLLLGLMLGCLVLLAVSCLILAVLHRDTNYAWYAVYAVAMTLTMGTITGASGHLLWNESPRWGDASQGTLPVMLAGVHLLFLRHLCCIAPRYPKVARAALLCGVAIVILSVAYLFASARAQSYIVATSMVTGAAFGFALAILAWRRHDAVGRWIILAYIPLALTIAVAILRLYGWVAATWLTLDASAAAAALAVPLLLLALNARSRDWHGVQTRVNKLTEQDALTGLLSPQAFRKQLQGAVSGALMRRESAAIVVVEIANLAQIRKFHGDAMAEQCLLRAVIKLHRVLRESDPAGRIDTGRFALIFEGVNSRDEVQARMVRLVASGLVPPRGARVEVPLQFHVACLLLGERVLAPDLALRDLGRLLSRMSKRSRRPVRFLEAHGPNSRLSELDEAVAA